MSELGSWLIRAREARGLTLEDAERDTRISRRYLQALESEQFDVIPAPVYARGFLRSYSQYLGLDPQEMLALFPRDDEPAYTTQQPAKPSLKEPLSAVGPARPAWRRPQPGEGVQPARGGQPGRPGPGRSGPSAGPFGRQAPRRSAEEPLGEPMIGVDIGVPVPKRNLGHDPAAQGRSALVAVVAIAAVLGVVMLALLISNMGGDSDPGSSSDDGETSVVDDGSGDDTSTPESTQQASGIPGVERGIVPDLIGYTSDKAVLAIQEAGGNPVEKRQKSSSKPKGEVIDQQPAPGTELPADGGVTIVVSDGP